MAYYSRGMYSSPADYWNEQQQNQRSDIQNVLNSFMVMKQYKMNQAEQKRTQAKEQEKWDFEQKKYQNLQEQQKILNARLERETATGEMRARTAETVAGRPRPETEFEFKKRTIAGMPPGQQYQAMMQLIGYKHKGQYPKSLVNKVAKTLGFPVSEWTTMDPTQKKNIIDMYKSQTGEVWTPQQERQIDKSFLGGILENINSSIRMYSDVLGLTPEALNTNPEMIKFRDAITFLTPYKLKKKLTEEDKVAIMPYANMQWIIGQAKSPTGSSMDGIILPGDVKKVIK